MNADKTIVVFRVYSDGDVIALFPNEDVDDRGHIASYMHVGQHGAADYTGVIMSTRPAKDSEYAPLKRELEAAPYEYRLDVRSRRSRR